MQRYAAICDMQRYVICGMRYAMFGGRWQWRVQLKSSHGYQWQPHQGAEHHHHLSQLCCGASKKMWLNGHSTEKIGLTKRPGTTGYSGGSDDQDHHQPTQQCSSLQQVRDHLGNTGAYGFPEDFPLHEAGPSSLPRQCRCETDGIDDEQESILSDEEAEVDATRPQDADGQHEEWMLPSWPPQPGMEPRPDPTALGVWLVLYCMHVERSGENCTVHTNEAGDDIIMMCNDCIHALECGRIPEAALARYDGGDVLEINQDGQHLEWPTVLEANILGLGHVQQQIYTLKVKNRPPDLQPITVTMHKIAMANPSLDQWVDTIPCSAVSLPENITVLCMDVVSSKEELLEKLKSTKVLSIRAANIVAWVNYLSNLTSERHIDDQVMKEWQAMDPECHKRTTHRRMLVSRSSEFWCLLSLTQLCRDQVMMHETRWSYTILDYSREDVLASNFPTAFLYTKGGIRPLGMSNRTFFQHVSTRVPQRQLSGNLLMLACMVDVLNMEDAKVQTWVTVKCCQQDIDTVGAIPREAVKVMADILALPKMHPDRRHLLQDMSPLVHTLITSLRAAAVVAAGQFLEFGEDGAPLWEERVMDKWWRVRNNPYTSQALLNTVKLAFMDILFGFKPGDKRQSNPDCFCGTVFHICICYMAARARSGCPVVRSVLEFRVGSVPYTLKTVPQRTLAFMDILFGFKPGDKRQSNPDCFCGTVFHICICYMAARGEELHLFAVPCMMADFCNATLRCCYTTHS
ncbi:hypothetical protein VOLCADRAFT_90904 [Volvox carteri f. nagariensis]|uniref:Uncharacterized protein n=1 Tax=Volvox carteri f. nagariensis TaxID=3068 RepID=D8TVD6_VOLCA|nr:uncharacterized protein VOLCADRAFT_90904 [Volvox carteri f. nagariensis]EFJ48559.1 hypothetical protein VOLCADRAFT_90904 [Volvox carteri f. nagariensis]|eukprot:XP_002950358.1 hypothetical protein VOLCADRAFT_90904 [Volvox carteri f. nagariensis]